MYETCGRVCSMRPLKLKDEKIIEPKNAISTIKCFGRHLLAHKMLKDMASWVPITRDVLLKKQQLASKL